MRVGISLTSNHPDVKDPRQGARWMIERAAAARRASLDSLFIGDQHVSPTPYYQNTPMLERLLAEWGEASAGCLFLLPLWHPVLVAEQIGTLAAIAQGPFIMQCGLGWGDARFAGLKPLSGSKRISLTFGRSGINARTAFRPISLSAFSPLCCGRPWRCGSSGPASATRRTLFSRNSRASTRMTSCCQPRHMASFDCAVSPSLTPPNPRFSTASVSSYPSACVSPNTGYRPWHSSPDRQLFTRNVVATFRPSY